MSEWSNLVLGECLEALIDNRGKNPPFVLVGVPVVSGGSVTDRGLELQTSRRVSPETLRKWMPESTREGDIVLTSEAPLGRVARITTSEPLMVAQRVFCLRGKRGVLHSRFLYYALKTKFVQAELAGRATGTTVLGIKQPELRKIRIPAPNYRTQCGIAEVLGALDDKIATNEHVATHGRSLARAIYDSYTAHATRTPASSVLDPILGGTPSRSDATLWNGEVPWVSARDISNAPFSLITATEEGISRVAARTKRLSPLGEGSVIVTARGTVGKVAQLRIPAAINQSCYGLLPGAIPRGCLRLLVEDLAIKAKSMAHGSVFDTINMSTFEHVVVPDLTEDSWSRVENHIAPIDALIESTVIEIDSLAHTRDQLLPLLMSGKVTVKDVEGEVEDLL